MSDQRPPRSDESLELQRWEDEPPLDEAERALAASTRRGLEAGADPLAAALRAAFSEPAAFDHEAAIARALGVEEAPASEAERRAAAALCAALDEPPARREPTDAVVLASALRAAWAPTELPALRNELLVTRALAASRRPRARYVGAIAGALAIAASIGLVLRSLPASAPSADLALTRSTAELFDPMTPFPRQGGTTARVDRIADARASELRANRFAAWGVK